MMYYSDYLVWDGHRLLARVIDYGYYVRVKPEPCCSLGEYFAVLTFLADLGYDAR